MSEQFYDEEIAPALAELAKKCADRGMTFVASVEWEPGESGSTVAGDIEKSGAGQLATALAARTGGNIDALLIGLMRRRDCSQSAILSQYQRDDK